MVNILEVIKEFTLNSREIGFNLLTSLIIVIVGIFIGKFVKLILSRVFYKLKFEKIFKFGTVEVGLTIIKWAIYLFFISFAIEQLELPYLSNGFLSSLSLIPKSIGALIILVGGFFLGKYLRDNVVQANKEWSLLGHICFYFFLYLAFIISIQLVFTSNVFLVNWISLIFTGFFLLFLVLRYRK